MNRALLSWIFKRLIRRRINELAAPNWFIKLDYPVDTTPRYGYGNPPHSELSLFFAAARPLLIQRVREWLAHKTWFEAIDYETPADSAAPHWSNSYFTGLDAVALMATLAEVRPALYLEVGSGNSTKFARRAIQDRRLATRIVSIDPRPRAEIDRLCDELIREPFERESADIAGRLRAGDVLFIDSSHRSFTNSDVTVFFLETLPALPPGVVLHLHDIFLPYDYPPVWRDRYYSEQYLLAAYLLGAGQAPRLRLLWSSVFANFDPALKAEAAPFHSLPRVGRALAGQAGRLNGIGFGTSIWLEVL
ncbi:MAG TPA: class I SAM-dependent methyltransferase [Burkholderiales bacterium]|nr:class I SAM-dependent methyltransferase [Burkholderiales bacterium]